MNELEWMLELRSDAHKNGLLSRFRSQTYQFWHRVYSEGVEPNVRSVISWALADPERFKDLQETEQKAEMMQIAA